MKTLHTLTPLSDKPLVLTIGNFDGVHLGHAGLLAENRQRAQKIGGLSAVLTFSNHPAEVFNPSSPFSYLTEPGEQKPKLIEKLGVDLLYLLPFTKTFASQCPDDFLKFLKEDLNLKELILGYDAKFGCEKKGTQEKVIELGKELGIRVYYHPAVKIDGKPISSTLIREAIISGDLDKAKALLGRPFSVYSEVVKGEGKGKTLGFPTANLDVEYKVLPPYGVYLCSAEVEGTLYVGCANLGVAPTMKKAGKPKLEVHFLDNPGNLYGKKLDVSLHRFIRGEKKFSSPKELANQILEDLETAKTSYSSSLFLT